MLGGYKCRSDAVLQHGATYGARRLLRSTRALSRYSSEGGK